MGYSSETIFPVPGNSEQNSSSETQANRNIYVYLGTNLLLFSTVYNSKYRFLLRISRGNR